MGRPHRDRRLAVFIGAILVTFVLVRAFLIARPETDAYLAGYNIHHLFTGALTGVVCAVPLVLSDVRGWLSDMLLAGFGISVALVLDEVVYLVATDGSNRAYLTAISWLGAICLIVFVCAYAAGVTVFAHGAIRVRSRATHRAADELPH